LGRKKVKHDWNYIRQLYIRGNEEYPDGVPLMRLSEMFGVKQSTIYKRRREHFWDEDKAKVRNKALEVSDTKLTKIIAKDNQKRIKALSKIEGDYYKLVADILKEGAECEDFEKKMKIFKEMRGVEGLGSVVETMRQVMGKEKKYNEKTVDVPLNINFNNLTLKEFESQLGEVIDTKAVDDD